MVGAAQIPIGGVQNFVHPRRYGYMVASYVGTQKKVPALIKKKIKKKKGGGSDPSLAAPPACQVHGPIVRVGPGVREPETGQNRPDEAEDRSETDASPHAISSGISQFSQKFSNQGQQNSHTQCQLQNPEGPFSYPTPETCPSPPNHLFRPKSTKSI